MSYIRKVSEREFTACYVETHREEANARINAQAQWAFLMGKWKVFSNKQGKWRSVQFHRDARQLMEQWKNAYQRANYGAPRHRRSTRKPVQRWQRTNKRKVGGNQQEEKLVPAAEQTRADGDPRQQPAEDAKEIDNDDGPLEEKELEQTVKETVNLTQKIEKNESDIAARKQIYTVAKKIYKQQQSPVFVNKKITKKLKENPTKYAKATAVPFTLTMDQKFEAFDAEKFKQEFSRKMNIPVSAIKIVSCIAGSVVCHVEITAFERAGKKHTLGAIVEKFTEKEATKRLVEFGVFLAEFGEPIDQFKPLKQKLIMNPKFNRVYRKDKISWTGSLNAEKAEPYYCPLGWTKYTTKVADTDDEFDQKYLTWPVAYHGTKFSLSMMISFSRLRAGGNPNATKASGADCFGTGVYFSPSIEYAAHPLYAHPKKMSKNAKQFAGKWVQVVLNCRLKPGCYTKHRGTIGDTSKQIDPNYNNSELEWLVHAPQGTYLDESKVVMCGYMIRTSDCDPRELPPCKWWNLDRYGTRVKKWYEE